MSDDMNPVVPADDLVQSSDTQAPAPATPADAMATDATTAPADPTLDSGMDTPATEAPATPAEGETAEPAVEATEGDPAVA